MIRMGIPPSAKAHAIEKAARRPLPALRRTPLPPLAKVRTMEKSARSTQSCSRRVLHLPSPISPPLPRSPAQEHLRVGSSRHSREQASQPRPNQHAIKRAKPLTTVLFDHRNISHDLPPLAPPLTTVLPLTLQPNCSTSAHLQEGNGITSTTQRQDEVVRVRYSVQEVGWLHG